MIVLLLVFLFLLSVSANEKIPDSSVEPSGSREVLCQFVYSDGASNKMSRLENQLDEIKTRLDKRDRGEGCQMTSCPDGWLPYKRSCFLFGTSSVDFQSARDFCLLHDAHLVWITTRAENVFLKNFMAKYLRESFYWIGANDDVTEGVWYVTGTPDWHMNFFDWAPTEPQDNGSGEDCVAFSKAHQYKWIDVPCSSLRTPLCEKKGT